MNERLDLTELLKDCPEGMELDCAMFDNVVFEEINFNYANYPIITRRTKTNERFLLTKYGQHSTQEDNKCIIFPKGKTTWEGFVPPYKDGDIAISDKGDIHLLRTSDSSYCAYRERWEGISKFDSTKTTGIKVVRLATEEEKQKLFDAIKANGYKWNAKTKTLEKLIVPKFKVGDIIKDKHGYKVRIAEVNIEDEYYGYVSLVANGVGCISFNEQDNWELIPNKFDPKTLQPFDKVLVRDYSGKTWIAAFFSHISDLTSFFNKFVTVAGRSYKQMIPYNEETKYLLGTNNEAPEYYKYWED